MKSLIIAYVVIVNIFAFFQFGDDKSRAKNGEWRISEDQLIGTALLGGSLGSWLGMRAFHHKTRHIKFRLCIPLLLIFHM